MGVQNFQSEPSFGNFPPERVVMSVPSRSKKATLTPPEAAAMEVELLDATGSAAGAGDDRSLPFVDNGNDDGRLRRYPRCE